jgi:hypothetical protein
VLVPELVDAVFRIRFDYEHRFAEHEHDFSAPFQFSATFQDRARSFSVRSLIMVRWTNRFAGKNWEAVVRQISGGIARRGSLKSRSRKAERSNAHHWQTGSSLAR